MLGVAMRLEGAAELPSSPTRHMMALGRPTERRRIVERQIVNPWSWQDQFGFVHANEVTGAGRVLVCAGQTSVDADGSPLHEGDMTAQVGQALDNLETVLREAGYELSDVLRLNYFVTDVDAFIGAGEIYGARLAQAECRPASTLLGVQRLAFPSLMVEIEATAAK
jgi:enamine deaminase RidA (YjgF/YER057c/UK114 family)